MSVAADGLRLAVGTLTVLPVRPPGRVDRTVAGVAMVVAPVAVLPVAVVAAAVVWGGTALALPPLVAATLALAVVALGTGGLHLDGLADTADGLASGGDRERRLEVMRRGDVGPSGAAALLVVVLVQVGALAGLVARDGSSAATGVLGALLVGRAVLAPACARGIPAARPDGLGSAVAGSVPPAAAVLVGGLTALAAAVAQGRSGLVGVALAAAVVVLLVVTCRRVLGGISGDVLGAGVELAVAGYLLAQVAGPGA